MDVVETKVPYGKHRRQYAVTIEHSDPGLRRPGRYAFYFHGGGWTFGRPETFTPAAIPWLARGFKIILPSYRRPPSVGMRRIVADCRAAVAHFSDPAASEVHVGGISAGAHLAAVLALTPAEWLRSGWPGPPSKALLCAGPYDLAELPVGRLLMLRYAACNPLRLVTPPDPAYPIAWQLLHGTIDPVVAPVHSARLYRALSERGHSADLKWIEGGRHLDAGRWMFGDPLMDTVRAFLSAD